MTHLWRSSSAAAQAWTHQPVFISRTSYNADDNTVDLELGRKNIGLDLLMAKLGLNSGRDFLMNFSNSDIEKLKVYFLAKVGGVMNGPVKPDKTDTHDLGTSSQRWNTIYAKADDRR